MLSTFKKATPDTLAEIQEEMKVRKTTEVFLLFALGSQFDHLIAMTLAKIGVYCLVADPNSVKAEDVSAVQPKGIILSGGPASVDVDPPKFDCGILDLKIPVLGICLGFQLWAKHLGVMVKAAEKREFSAHELSLLNQESPLFAKCEDKMPVLQSHGDKVFADAKINVLARTENAEVAAANFEWLWGVQFHPEVTETIFGEQIFENFCFGICRAQDKFPAANAAHEKIAELRQQVGGRKVLLALSGGSDSSVAAYLLKEAGVDIVAVYIKAVDRPDDEEYVQKFFAGQDWLDLKIVDATDRFLQALQGKVSMKEKRVAMRGVYKPILEEQAKSFGAEFIAQGTLYTDISESGHGYDSGAKKAQIKLHHNVNLGFSLPEITPLSDCVKDNARNIGREIGVPEELLARHPFPGPGLVVRIEGEVTQKKLEVARLVDGIWIEELRKNNYYHAVWQAGAVVSKSVTTCTKGDDAVDGWVIALWAVWSVNGFTAQAALLPGDFIAKASRRITNEVREAGAVVYRYSDKPPATIEWG